MRSRHLRRSASESAVVVGESHDGSFVYPDASSAQPSPFKPATSLPAFRTDKGENASAPRTPLTDILGNTTAGEPKGVTTLVEVTEEREKGAGEEDDYPVPSAWGDEPSPEQLQQIQDRVSAWLTTSRPSGSMGLCFPSSTTDTPSTLVDVPEEDETELIAVRQPLRMLDSISEDDVPPFVGSSVSTAPSTPLPPLAFPQLSRPRSRSPPLRRRSLDGQEEYYSRGLDTIQEAGDAPLAASPRRSLDSMKRPVLALEPIPEIEPSHATSSSHSKRRLGIKGFGFTRSESEPLMPTFRNVPLPPATTPPKPSKRKAPSLSANIFVGGKPVPRSGFGNGKEGMPPSPSLPSFQRGIKLVMGQRSAGLDPVSESTLPSEPRRPLSLRIHSPGSIAAEVEKIEDEEQRRQTELAFM